MSPREFTLQPRQWYALEMIFPSGVRHVSPIYCHGARPRKSGAGWLELDFFHANYAEGVNHKIYELRVLSRGPSFLLAGHPCGEGEAGVVITELTEPWMQTHFAWLLKEKPRASSVAEMLDRRFPNLE